MRCFAIPALARLLGAVACLALVGCGPPTGSVTGTVKFKGKLLTAGNVTYFGSDGLPGVAQIKDDGTYSIARVATGQAKITVVSQDPRMVEDLKKFARPKKAADKPPPFDAGKYQQVPAKYGDMQRSGLTFTVQAGENTHDIELK